MFKKKFHHVLKQNLNPSFDVSRIRIHFIFNRSRVSNSGMHNAHGILLVVFISSVQSFITYDLCIYFSSYNNEFVMFFRILISTKSGRVSNEQSFLFMESFSICQHSRLICTMPWRKCWRTMFSMFKFGLRCLQFVEKWEIKTLKRWKDMATATNNDKQISCDYRITISGLFSSLLGFFGQN